MFALPQAAESLLMSFSIAFAEPTFQRTWVLLVGAILSKNRRTTTSMLWTVGDLADGDPSDYHRVFRRAAWSLWTLGRILATAVIKVAELTRTSDWIRIAIDGTVAEHKERRSTAKVVTTMLYARPKPTRLGVGDLGGSPWRSSSICRFAAGLVPAPAGCHKTGSRRPCAGPCRLSQNR